MKATSSAAAPFSGFPRESTKFFRDLARHNNRDWFEAHRGIYERACKEPMHALVAELAPAYGRGYTKIFRINRDIRFSADKSPYKTHMGAVVGGHYLGLDADGLYVGTGMYRPEPPTLERFRNLVADDTTGKPLERIVKALRRKGYSVDTHERTTNAPRGYRVDHPRIDLLRMKDIFAGRQFGPEPWLATRQTVTRVKKVIADLKPFRTWLDDHLK